MKNTNNMPECLTITVDEAAVILGISRSLAYSCIEQAFLEHGPFKVLRIGKCYRVLKASFYEYVLGQTEGSV